MSPQQPTEPRQSSFGDEPVPYTAAPRSQYGDTPFQLNIPTVPPRNKGLPDFTNQQVRDFAIRSLPAVGATAGAAAWPAVGGVPGAIAGGYLGGLFQAGANRPPTARTGRYDYASRLRGYDMPDPFMGEQKQAMRAGVEQGAMQTGGAILGGLMKFTAKRLFTPSRMVESSIRPSTTLDIYQHPGAATSREQIVNTFLQEGGVANDHYYLKLTQDIAALNADIASRIKNKAPVGDVIDPRVIARRLEQLEQFYSRPVGGGEVPGDLDTIRQLRQAYLEKHSIDVPYQEVSFRPGVPQGTANRATPRVQAFPGEMRTARLPQPYSIQEAQAEKQATYAIIRNRNFGEMASTQIEAEKALAYALKEQIAALFPEISALNARDSGLIALERELARFVGSDRNKNLIGMKQTVIGGAVGAAGGALFGAGHTTLGMGSGVLGVALIALDNPTIKSKLAGLIWRAGQTIPGRMLAQVADPTRLLPAAGRATMLAIPQSRQQVMDRIGIADQQ